MNSIWKWLKGDDKKKEEEERVNTRDAMAVKGVLDAAVVDLLESERNRATTDKGYENARLKVGLVSIVIAAIAHLFPLPFPENMYILFACCVAYFACTAVIQYYLAVCEANAIWFGHTSASGRLFARSDLQQFPPTYSLRILRRNDARPSLWAIACSLLFAKSSRADDVDGNLVVEFSGLITDWFSESGRFAKSIFDDALQAHLAVHLTGNKRE
jgi:Microsomal signal peptidase 25 kDa subunit (SPC25)